MFLESSTDPATVFRLQTSPPAHPVSFHISTSVDSGQGGETSPPTDGGKSPDLCAAPTSPQSDQEVCMLFDCDDVCDDACLVDHHPVSESDISQISDLSVSFRTEVTGQPLLPSSMPCSQRHTPVPPSDDPTAMESIDQIICPCKDEVDKEEAEALVEALEQSGRPEPFLPTVAGLVSPSRESPHTRVCTKYVKN